MYRASIVVALLGIAGAEVVRLSARAWPLRATITALGGHSIAFRAVSRGGDLIVDRSPDGMHPQPLARGDTLSATTPASFPLDVRRGPVMFFTTSRDRVRVAVGWNPGGAISQVSARGHRLTVRLVNGSIVIDAQ